MLSLVRMHGLGTRALLQMSIFIRMIFHLLYLQYNKTRYNII